ncbi:hypothetical protein RHSIM_Rhsim07G0061200 [Rhododendron simsii]|uniref:Uncharacterized protein n=1 Tax=Rhododendron simsii TaxID=118357 RepID=A0A834LLC5_RHOSS|nr:hypothetical protein RHSIM_Rhsim07G0061200 [Rhododendron simsii]
MSLVDYASSDEEDEAGVGEEGVRGSFQSPKDESKRDQPPSLPPQSQKSGLLSNEHLRSSKSSEPSVVKLPDASLLLNSTVVKLPDASLLLNSTPVSSDLVSGSDHSSRVAAAIAERESRKREANILASALPRSKVPKGTLPQQKSIPDTVAGLLVPPQLSGRSNIVTEDIGKLFVRRNADPASQLLGFSMEVLSYESFVMLVLVTE